MDEASVLPMINNKFKSAPVNGLAPGISSMATQLNILVVVTYMLTQVTTHMTAALERRRAFLN